VLRNFLTSWGGVLSLINQNLAETRWLSVDEIAMHLGIKKDTVYKWVAKKQMPAHKVGRLLKFDKSEIDHWVKSGAAESRAN
jgi:excisionase family DNA binding protein